MAKKYTPLQGKSTYDDKGREIEYKDNKGCRYTRKYDDDKRIVVYQHWQDGIKQFHHIKKFDERGRCIYKQNSRGLITIRKFVDDKLVVEKTIRRWKDHKDREHEMHMHTQKY